MAQTSIFLGLPRFPLFAGFCPTARLRVGSSDDSDQAQYAGLGPNIRS